LTSYAKVLDIARNGPDIRSQLALLGILNSCQLPMTISNLRPESIDLVQGGYEQASSQDSIEDDANRYGYLYSKFPPFASGVFLVCLIIAIYKGYERFVYRGQPIVVAIIIVAWVAGVIAMYWLVTMSSGHSFWSPFSENASASPGSYCVSASTYGRAENIGIASIVISKLELSNVQREIFSADFVETSHNPSLQERPEPSIVWVWTAPLTYSPRPWRTNLCG
jgi:hypothetical protein